MNPRLLIWIALGGAFAAGCNAAFGIDDLKTADPLAADGGHGGDGGTGGSTTAGGMGGGEACADGMVCVPASSDAVSYAVLIGATEGCPEALSGRTVGSCADCACDDDGGDCTLSATLYTDDACTNSLASTNTPGCINPSGAIARWFIANVTPNDNASCMPTAPTVAPTLLQACETATPEPCDTGVCMPEAPSTCILTAGSCPAPYDVQRVVYLDGTEACACSCSSGPQGCEAATLTVYAQGGTCSTMPSVMVPTDGTCQPAGPTDSFSIPSVSGTVTCGSSGTIMGAMAQTLCCLP